MCADRVVPDSMPVTQESLAQVLGTRRSSVTIAVNILQENGLIHYRRGEVGLLDRGAENCLSVLRTHAGVHGEVAL